MKTTRTTLLGLVLLLTLLEQGLKVIINKYYLYHEWPLFKQYLYFRPVFNRDYSWFNSMLQLNLGRTLHIALVAMMLVIIYLAYEYIFSLGSADSFISTAFAFLFSGALCSLIDKVFWDGSLDYIYVRGFFTFDLKDVYINVFIGLFLLMVVINHKGIRQMDDGKALRGFWAFVRQKWGR